MRVDDLFSEPSALFPDEPRRLDTALVGALWAGPHGGHTDVEVAVPLTRLVHDELLRYGTDGGVALSEDEIRTAMQALRSVADRLGVTGSSPSSAIMAGSAAGGRTTARMGAGRPGATSSTTCSNLSTTSSPTWRTMRCRRRWPRRSAPTPAQAGTPWMWRSASFAGTCSRR